MEKTKSKGFTAKDEFNASSAIPIKEVKGETLNVKDVMVTEKFDEKENKNVIVGYIKTDDEQIYATISVTIINQLLALVEMVEDGIQTVSVHSNQSNSGREYFMLKLI